MMHTFKERRVHGQFGLFCCNSRSLRPRCTASMRVRTAANSRLLRSMIHGAHATPGARQDVLSNQPLDDGVAHPQLARRLFQTEPLAAAPVIRQPAPMPHALDVMHAPGTALAVRYPRRFST